VFLALYLAVLQPVLRGADSPAEAALQVSRALVFLSVLFAIARYGSKAVGRVIDTDDEETLTVMFVGLAVLVAGIAREMGVSEAIGAFMVGMILSETTARERVERLVLPLRDAFAAVFFFAFGLTIDPGDIGAAAGPVTIAVALTIILNIVAALIGARLFDYGRREAVNTAFTLVGRGEFSLILATLALAAGLDARIGSFVALYVLVLAILGPILASRSEMIARLLPSPAPRAP